MITAEERQAALRELSFNRWKALKLFFFCFASFVVGLTALYWTLDQRYAQRIEVAKEQLIQEMLALKDHYQMQPIADLYEGVVAYEGRADFDQAHVIVIPKAEFKEKGELIAVKGQKRELAPSVYQIRFVVADANANAVAASDSEADSAAAAENQDQGKE